MLREHLENHGTGPGDLIFTGPRGELMTDRAYLKVFHEARAAALTPEEAASPLLEVPYALRHAAVSTWPPTSGDAARVAGWAGHSDAVLLRVYAKCIHGMEDEVLRSIWGAIRHDPADTSLEPELSQVTSWQVLGSNQRRLSRRFYREAANSRSERP